MNTRLTVILVTRDAMPHVTSAIAQADLAAQRWNAQVVAVDGGSRDGTWEELTRRPEWVVRRQQSTGLAAARNEALALADGDVVAFLDADDTWVADKTDKQLQVLTEDPGVGVVSCQLQRVGLGTTPLTVATPQKALTPSGCLIRREVFDRVGRFDTQYRIAADHEWFARAQQAGVRFTVLPEVLLAKGVHGANLSHDRATYRRELAHVFRSLNEAGAHR